MNSFLRHLREAQDQRFQEAMEEASSFADGAHAPQEDSSGNGSPLGTLTIDLDLPPVDAAPKPKGPKWRLRVLREWTREGAEERRRSRQLQQAAGIGP